MFTPMQGGNFGAFESLLILLVGLRISPPPVTIPQIPLMLGSGLLSREDETSFWFHNLSIQWMGRGRGESRIGVSWLLRRTPWNHIMISLGFGELGSAPPGCLIREVWAGVVRVSGHRKFTTGK